MTEKREVYQIGLSREELLTIMSYMEIKELAGFDLEWVEALTEEQKIFASEIAERALFARTFIARDKDAKIFVNPLVFAAVGACASPEISVLLRQIKPENPLITTNFHISRQMNVIHFMPHPMLHQFLAVDEKEKLMKALLSALSLPNSMAQLDQEPVKIPLATLNEARQDIKEGRLQGLEEKFETSSFTPEGADVFAKALSKPVSYSILIMVDQKKEKAEDLSLLQGADSLWMIEPDIEETDKEKIVTISATTGDCIVEKLTQFIKG